MTSSGKPERRTPSRPLVFITRRLPDEAVKPLLALARVRMNREDIPLSADELKKQLRTADAAITLLTDRVDKTLLLQCPRLRIVANVAVGFENIDIEAANRLKVVVTNTPNVLTTSTANLTMAMILAVTRRVVEADRYLRDGKFKGWSLGLLTGMEIEGKVLGIVGFGRIGQAVAHRARSFGMKVVYFDKAPDRQSAKKLSAVYRNLPRLLETSDVVTLHVPYASANHHLIGKQELAGMKPSSFLINTARGPLVDEAALVQSLKRGRLSGAGLDVYEKEPEVHPGLLALPNVVLLPHIGSATWETRLAMAQIAVDNVVRVLQNRKPRTPV